MTSTQHDWFTEIIDITLYKYNSIDLKLWGIINRDAKSRPIGEGSRLVPRDRMEEYLHYAFKSDINRFNTVSDIT